MRSIQASLEVDANNLSHSTTTDVERVGLLKGLVEGERMTAR